MIVDTKNGFSGLSFSYENCQILQKKKAHDGLLKKGQKIGLEKNIQNHDRQSQPARFNPAVF